MGTQSKMADASCGAVGTKATSSDAGVVCCAVTSGLGDSARTPSLAPLLAFTLSTYEFTIGASEAWWTALQVAPMKFNPPAFGLPNCA